MRQYFNNRSCGIFCDGYQDRHNVPVSDTAAAMFRARTCPDPEAARDWPLEWKLAYVRKFSSDEIARVLAGRYREDSL